MKFKFKFFLIQFFKMYGIKCLRHVKKFSRYQSIAASSCHQSSEPLNHKFLLSKPIFDENFLLNENYIEKISKNIKLRKGVGDIKLVHDLKNKLRSEVSADVGSILNQQLQEELKKIPNGKLIFLFLLIKFNFSCFRYPSGCDKLR